MAKVNFAPNRAIKYIGSKTKELHSSLARPKPILKKGDIVIVDKKTAANLTIKGFGEFEVVNEITFIKKDKQISQYIEELEEKLECCVGLKEHEAALLRIEELEEYISTQPGLEDEIKIEVDSEEDTIATNKANEVDSEENTPDDKSIEDGKE